MRIPNLNLKLKLNLLLVVALAGCSSKAQTPAQPQPWYGDTLLAPVLNAPVVGRAELNRMDSLASVLREDFNLRLVGLIEDTLVPAHIRTKAIYLLSQRSYRLLDPYINAYEDRDERLRIAAIAALDELIDKSSGARALARRALGDPSPVVQTKALEVLGDADLDALRAVSASNSNAGVKKIALDLLSAAEDRGAPLTADSAGGYKRTAPSGHAIHFTPALRWPQWSLSSGTLYVSARGKAPVKVADQVEVAHGVVPAFITPDGLKLIYEAGRQVHVLDLVTNTTRTVGAGIAPRLLPFSQSFVYLRPGLVTANPQGSSIRYEVVRVDPAGPEKKLGDFTVTATMDSGHTSPARWMRVREIGGKFFLTADGNAVFELPNAFGG